MILLILIYLLFFLLSDLFHHILYHQSYPYDLFHRIISQYYLYFSANSIFPVSILLYHQSLFIHQFTYLVSFVRALVIPYIYPIYFIRFFLDVAYIFLRNQFSQIQDFYITSHYFLIIFTYLISFIRFLVITHIYSISFIILFLNIVHIFL